jgi:hypothetical protein
MLHTNEFYRAARGLHLGLDTLEQWAACRETSAEVAVALHEVAEGDADRADSIWQDPSDEEFTRVTARAWDLAAPEDVQLSWGLETLRR